MTQVPTSTSISKELASAKLHELFFEAEKMDIPCILVEEYALWNGKELVVHKPEKGELFIAIIGKEHQYYHILGTRGSSQDWGVKPPNYYFGLRQALDIAVFKNPINRLNLLLCNDLIATLCFLFSGIPAMLVDDATVWQDPYFNQIVRPMFPNIIVTHNDLLPKGVRMQKGIKVFDLDGYLKAMGLGALSDHILMEGFVNDLLEALFELYEFIDDDRLLDENNLQGEFSIQD